MRCAQVGLPMTEQVVEVEVWVRHKGATICVLRDQAGGVDALEEWLEGFSDYRCDSFEDALELVCEWLDDAKVGKPAYFDKLHGYKKPPLFEIKLGSFRLLSHYGDRIIVVVHWDRKRAMRLRNQDLEKAHRRAKLVDSAITNRRLKINGLKD